MNALPLDPAISSRLFHTALAAHALASGYVLVNGAAHQAAVLWKAWRGSLPTHAHLGSLLAIGAGLIVSGGFMSLAFAPLVRERPQTLPAVASVLFLALVLAAITGAIRVSVSLRVDHDRARRSRGLGRAGAHGS